MSPCAVRSPRELALSGLVLLLWLGLSSATWAAGPIEELLQQDGTWTLLEEVSLTLDEAVRSQGDAAEDAGYDSAALLNRFSASRLRNRLTQLLGTSWRIEEGKEVATWFASPVGRSLRDADRALREPEAQRLMGVYVATFGQLGSQEDRVALAERILEARRDIERLEAISRIAIAVSLEVIERSTPAAERWTAEERDEEIDLALQELRAELRERALWRVLFTHRSVPLEEVSRHAEFLEGEAASWYFRDVGEALERTLQEALEAWRSSSRQAAVSGQRLENSDEPRTAPGT